MYGRRSRFWTLAAFSGLLLTTACTDTSTLPSEIEPQFARGGGGPKKPPPEEPVDSRVLWEVATGGWVFGGAASDGETLYFSSSSDRFYAVGVDGQVRWTRKAQIDDHEPPVVEEGVVYFTAAHEVFALEAASGNVKWSRKLGSGKGKRRGPYLGGLNVSGQWIHVGNSDGYLFTLDKKTGETVHSVLVGTDHAVWTVPTFVDGRLYVAARLPGLQGVVHSFVVDQNGSLTSQETSDVVGNIGTSLVHDGGNTLYFTSRDGNFYAMHIGDQTLRTLKSVQIDLDGSQAASSAAIGEDGTIYVASYDTCFPTGGPTTTNACLYAINPVDLAVEWTAPVGTTVWNSSPAIGADGTIYIGNTDGLLVAISSSGDQLWTFQTANEVNGSPTISGTTLFVGSDDGSMYALVTNALTEDGGLANSVWPKLRADAANSGVAQ